MSEKNNLQSNQYIYKPIGNYLIKADLVTLESIDRALEEQKKTKERIGAILVRQGNIKQKTLDYIIEQVIAKDRINLFESEDKSKNYCLNLPTLNIYPRKILLMAIATLIIFSFLERLAIDKFNELANTQLTTRFFGLDEEANFPTLYSMLSLGTCSFLLAIITTIKNKINSHYTKFWRLLSLIFLFLAVDESCSIHEILIPILRGLFNTTGFLYFPWVIPAVILLILFLVVFREFIINLPARIRSLFLIAGGIYIGGALGMEFIGGYLADNIGLEITAYLIATSIEEFLEMFGILIFTYGLLSYIKSYFQEVNITLSFQKPLKKQSIS